MIDRLRRKFILLTILSLTVVLTIIMSAVNLLNYKTIYDEADDILQILTENHGEFPKDRNWKEPWFKKGVQSRFMSPETPHETRFFSAMTDGEGNIVRTNLNFIAAVDEAGAESYAKIALSSRKSVGMLDIYRYQVADWNDGKVIIFLDCGRQLATANTFLIVSIMICVFGISAVFVLVFILSKRAVKPMAESYEKQKQFITNSNHELKTPLAVISANIDVIEMEHGENEWTLSIKRQVEKLSAMTKSLTALSRMDEVNLAAEKQPFNLSDAVLDTAEDFRSVAEKDAKTLTLNIAELTQYHGNEEMLRRLTSILMDNAVKYSLTGIRLTLKRQRGKIVLEVWNDADNVNKGNLDIFLERFYRQQHSDSTPGFGIGLSIAKSIVEAHGGNIHAKSSDGKSVTITVLL